LLAADDSSLAEVHFVVVDPSAPATIVAAKGSFEVGEPVEVSWTNGPGNRYDWIALSPAGTGAHGYLVWRYVDARVIGTASIGRASDGPWPLPPGDYEVNLCSDDSYDCVATTPPFSVVG
jgi:hypothetical protein